MRTVSGEFFEQDLATRSVLSMCLNRTLSFLSLWMATCLWRRLSSGTLAASCSENAFRGSETIDEKFQNLLVEKMNLASFSRSKNLFCLCPVVVI